MLHPLTSEVMLLDRTRRLRHEAERARLVRRAAGPARRRAQRRPDRPLATRPPR